MKKYRLTLENLAQARRAYCAGNRDGNCVDCPIYTEQIKADLSCGEFVERYPDKAAELMGLEVIDVPPVLTEQERALCKMLGAKYVSKEDADGPFDPDRAELWTDRPERPGKVWQCNGRFRGIASVDARLFPSIEPGELAEIEDDEEE